MSALKEAVKKVFEQVVKEAVEMALATPPAERPAKMLALRATIADRLIAEGVDPERATTIAKAAKLEVDVPGDHN